MDSNKKNLLKKLKGLSFETAQIRLFFVRRYLIEHKLSVSVFEPEITPELAKKIAAATKRRLMAANSLEDYAPLTADSDENLLVANPVEAHWDVIQTKLSGTGRAGVKAAARAEDLKDCEFYVAEFDFDSGPALYAAKRLPQKLSINRLRFDQWLFKGGKLDALDDGRVFNVVLGVDFLSWRDHVIVVEKSVFEAIMNIREGMARKRDDLLKDLQKLDRFEGLSTLRTTIGDNAHLLRRATQIKDSKNLDDPNFIATLFDVVEKHPSWGITVKDGKIVITPDNSDGILSLLNDARAESFIRRQVFDAIVKKPVG